MVGRALLVEEDASDGSLSRGDAELLGEVPDVVLARRVPGRSLVDV